MKKPVRDQEEEIAPAPSPRIYKKSRWGFPPKLLMDFKCRKTDKKLRILRNDEVYLSAKKSVIHSAPSHCLFTLEGKQTKKFLTRIPISLTGSCTLDTRNKYRCWNLVVQKYILSIEFQVVLSTEALTMELASATQCANDVLDAACAELHKTITRSGCSPNHLTLAGKVKAKVFSIDRDISLPPTESESERPDTSQQIRDEDWSSTLLPVECGETMRAKYFKHHLPTFRLNRLNHGSYGAVPTVVLEKQEALRKQWLRNPDAFFELEHPKLMLKATSAVARMVGVTDPTSVTLVENATTASTTVADFLGALWYNDSEWEPGEVVLCSTVTYDSTENAIIKHCVAAGASIEHVELPLPIASPAEVVAAYALHIATRPSGSPKIRAAVLDHVVSKSGCVMPVSEIVTLLRAHGVEQIYCDGAHGPGMLDLDLPATGVDFYCGVGPSASPQDKLLLFSSSRSD